MQRKEREEKEKKGTSDLGSSSKMGPVTGVSSLCLDYKEKRGEQKKRLKEKKKGGGGVNRVSHKKAKKERGYFKGNLLSAQQQMQDKESSFSCFLVFCWQGEHL